MNAELQAKARKLFLQTDLSKTEIATVLGIPIRTLHYWVGVQRWDIQKQCATQMPSAIATNCYQLLANFTGQLLAPERRGTLMTHKEAETIHKLTVTISKLKARTTLSENMDIFNNFLQNVRSYSPQLADIITPHVTAFIATGATAPTAAPAHTPGVSTEAELEEEARLDREEELEEQREREQQQQKQQTEKRAHSTYSPPAKEGEGVVSPQPQTHKSAPASAPVSSERDGERFARAA
jgi:hypothetical protein